MKLAWNLRRLIYSHKYGIEPPDHHFECPMHLIEQYGGWREPSHARILRASHAPSSKGLVKYWLTFNEINMILHKPFMGALCFEEGENEEQVIKQPIASWSRQPLPPKLAHEIDPENKVGCIWRGSKLS